MGLSYEKIETPMLDSVDARRERRDYLVRAGVAFPGANFIACAGSPQIFPSRILMLSWALDRYFPNRKCLSATKIFGPTASPELEFTQT